MRIREQPTKGFVLDFGKFNNNICFVGYEIIDYSTNIFDTSAIMKL